MDDFIFGTLATDQLRLAHERALRSGVTHNHARSPRDPAPGQPITLELTVGPVHACDRAWVYWTGDGSDPAGEGGIPRQGHALEMQRVATIWDVVLWGYRQVYRVVLPAQPAGTVVRYRLAAAGEGEETLADSGRFYGFYVADDPAPESGAPEWARDAVVYQIFVDRFFPGSGKSWLHPEWPSGLYGGTLRGITEKMDYIAGLGVDVLWLSPIFPSPSHHGYDATDYFDIEPRLGTKADLAELLEAAHVRGIRVLLDFVPNHWSHLHPTFQEASTVPNSPYRDWYNFRSWPDDYETFFGVKELPQVNLRFPAARQHMLDAAAYWLKFGVDGYRLDYAIGPAMDFWADFRKTTRSVQPACWTFGEVVDPPDSQLAFDGLLDGCLDFVLLEAIRQTFAFGRWEPAKFASFLDRHEAYFPPGFSRPSFLDNHDMNRFLWAAGGSIHRLTLAALCQFSLWGPPVIYYGTEAGLSQERDVRQGDWGLPEESRLPMLWDSAQNTSLLAFYRQLIALRRQHPALRQGVRTWLHRDEQTLAYARRLPGEPVGDETATVLNLSSRPADLTLAGAWSLALPTQESTVVRLTGGQTQLILPPLAGALLLPES